MQPELALAGVARSWVGLASGAAESEEAVLAERPGLVAESGVVEPVVQPGLEAPLGPEAEWEAQHMEAEPAGSLGLEAEREVLGSDPVAGEELVPPWALR